MQEIATPVLSKPQVRPFVGEWESEESWEMEHGTAQIILFLSLAKIVITMVSEMETSVTFAKSVREAIIPVQ